VYASVCIPAILWSKVCHISFVSHICQKLIMFLLSRMAVCVPVCVHDILVAERGKEIHGKVWLDPHPRLGIAGGYECKKCN